MATIPVQATGLRHVRKTIALDGGANNGNLGDTVPLFTTTGRVLVLWIAPYISEALVCTAPTLTGLFILAGTGYIGGLGEGGWDFTGATGVPSSVQQSIAQGNPTANNATPYEVAANIGFQVFDGGGGADVTDGTIIFDVWYYPITDDGALTGDDIDTELVDAILDEVVEGSYTLRQLTRLMAAALLGELSGAATTTITIRDASDTKTRITATVDGDGNRSALTLDAS